MIRSQTMESIISPLQFNIGVLRKQGTKNQINSILKEGFSSWLGSDSENLSYTKASVDEEARDDIRTRLAFEKISNSSSLTGKDLKTLEMLNSEFEERIAGVRKEERKEVDSVYKDFKMMKHLIGK